MTTTSAVVATAFGGPEALTVVEQEVPAPGPGQVRLRVRAAGVNPIDYKLYGGARGTDPSLLPMPLGFEVSGEVVEVGADATGPLGDVHVGDDVIAFRISGGYAGEVTVPASSVLPKPASLGWHEAAGLMLTGTTAIHALTVVDAVGDAAKEQVVLVHGASGSVGQLVAQIALHDGARVIGTASAANADLLRSYGVLPVTYGPGLAERVRAALAELGASSVDAVVDTVGTDEAFEVSVELVADPARRVTIAGFGRPTGAITAIGGGPGADAGTEIRDAARLRLVDLAGSGQLRVVVARAFPLAEAAVAHELVAGGHPGGKVVLVP